MKANLANRIEKLTAQVAAMNRKELIGGWMHADETEESALARMVASSRITIEEQDQVQLARWLTPQEAKRMGASDA